MKLYVLVGILATLWLSISNSVDAKATRASMDAAGKLMRNVCQPKNKTPSELIDNMKNLQFPEDRSLMCYVNCVMNMMQTMKSGKFNYEAAMKQVDLAIPDNMKAATRDQLTQCKDVAAGYKDACEAAFFSLKCMVTANPSNYFFP